MRIQGRKPTKVLAVFEEGKPPVPCKYKIKDRYGQEETVVIHKITTTRHHSAGNFATFSATKFL